MKKVLSQEIATLTNQNPFIALMNFLPDPDILLTNHVNPVAHYKKLMNDPHLSATVVQRKALVKSMLYELDKTPYTPEIEEVLKNKINLKKFINQCLDAVYFGFTVHEIVWKYENGKYEPKAIYEKPQDWFAFDLENNLKMKNPQKFNELIELPDYKFILTQYNDSYINPYGEKTIKKCYWNVRFKANGMEFWSYFVEKYGMPFLEGELSTSVYEGKKGELLENLIAMKRNGVIVKREGTKINLIESTQKSGSTSAYKEYINFNNEEISKAILTVTLTTDSKGGSGYAQSKTHKEMIDEITDGDKSIVEKSVDKLIEYYCKINHGEIEAPKFHLYPKKEVDKELADRDKTLTEQGVKFTKEYYMETYNLKESDFDIEK